MIYKTANNLVNNSGIITDYQISSDSSNSQLQRNKPIAIRHKSVNKNESHHKHNNYYMCDNSSMLTLFPLYHA